LLDLRGSTFKDKKRNGRQGGAKGKEGKRSEGKGLRRRGEKGLGDGKWRMGST